MHIRPGVQVLWCGPTTVQVGADERWAVRLTDLSADAAGALRSLPRGAEVAALRALLEQEHVDPAEADTIVEHLLAAHLVVGAPDRAQQPDEAVWSLLSADGAGDRVVGARRLRRVRVVGLGRLGLQVAAGLAGAGVGVVELDDRRPVTREDVGTGYTVGDIGLVRALTAARHLHGLVPTVRAVPLNEPGRGCEAASTCDVVVLVEHGAPDPVRHQSLMAQDVTHLSVVVREASVLVGPMVEPGRTACLHCVDLHRTDMDDHWPLLAAQLVAAPDLPEESVLACSSGALAAAQVLAQIDGRPVHVHDGALEVRLPEVVPRTLSWERHDGCGCTAPVHATAREAALLP
ncbi:ThiF family adenylyltransferase [Cellulomonas bogoriensis]|uniref:Thiamine biosynthesis protein ThiF n=1 Tax=Cellulomonas bogoriensis 69B4 = DSM 16987 TaxID=1386082 RepID=A0A0A0BPV8_9CELL|nr:ThiF family adenylyltransferase [Cellulomonas bogoriensis]KGM09677.1 thiamine biosynthesis protein ThiF [Cellulomonas bogoriensis 69B4 = DSM 16987]